MVYEAIGNEFMKKIPASKFSYKYFRPYFDVNLKDLIIQLIYLCMPFRSHHFNANLYIPFISFLSLFMKLITRAVFLGERLTPDNLSVFGTKLILFLSIFSPIYYGIFFITGIRIEIMQMITLCSYKFFYLLFFFQYRSFFCIFNIGILFIYFVFILRVFKIYFIRENKKIFLMGFAVIETAMLFISSLF